MPRLTTRIEADAMRLDRSDLGDCGNRGTPTPKVPELPVLLISFAAAEQIKQRLNGAPGTAVAELTVCASSLAHRIVSSGGSDMVHRQAGGLVLVSDGGGDGHSSRGVLLCGRSEAGTNDLQRRHPGFISWSSWSGGAETGARTRQQHVHPLLGCFQQAAARASGGRREAAVGRRAKGMPL